MRLGYVLLLCLVVGCGAEQQASSGPRLYLAGDGEFWVVDASRQTVRHVVSAQLKPGDAPHRVLARGDRVIMGSPYGDSAFFMPSARDDRVWVVDLRATDATVRTVREVTADGETTVAAVRTPTPRWPLGAVREGLLLESDGGVDVWDPATQRVVRHLPIDPVEVGASSDATVTACQATCLRLRLIDARTGAEREVRAPTGYVFEPWSGVFAPAGDHLALPVLGAGAARRLALVDLATARVGIVPGSRVPAGYNMVAWSAAGRHVFFTGGDRFEHRVIVGYRLGTRRARVLDVRVGDFYDLAAT